MGLSPEREVTVEYTIRVSNFGKPEQVAGSTTRTLARALHSAFGEDGWNLYREGRLIGYDALADDGHHEGHDVVLTETPAPAAELPEALRVLQEIAAGRAGNAQKRAADFLGGVGHRNGHDSGGYL